MDFQALSGGNQQKVVLAKWLQAEPRVLLVHEPTQGVDIGARLQVFETITQAAAEGMSVVCASSDYEQLAAICDRVLVFHGGQIMCTLVGDEITKDRITEQCYMSARTLRPDKDTRMPGMNQVSPGAAGELLPPTASEPQRQKKGFSPGDYVERLALVIAWLVVIVVFSILAPDTFFKVRNFTTMFSTQTTLVILALALLIPLTAGDYDISVAATLTFSGMVVAVLNAQHGVPIGLAIAIAIAAGALIGLINGFFIIFFEIDAFIVTLGTGTIILGLTLWLSASQTISGVSDWLSSWVVVHRLFGISYEFFYGLLLCVFLWYVFDYTAIGRRILFVGRGTNVARLSGIRVGTRALGVLRGSRRSSPPPPECCTPGRPARRTQRPARRSCFPRLRRHSSAARRSRRAASTPGAPSSPCTSS